ncbi:MAG: diaminopimelate epimerase [Rickettsiales bacterium]
MSNIPFQKMHGTGNDFVVIDVRKHALKIDEALAKHLADRRLGIGCDQLVVIDNSKTADAYMHIYNCDGSKISTCGNASRCVGDMLMRELKKDKVTIETGAGVVNATRIGADLVQVDMGEPKWDWQQIPLSESRNTLHLGLEEGGLMDPVAVNMGNPHAIFFVRDTNFVRMGEWGKKLEVNPLFPERANISAVQVLDANRLRMKVWERGTGETLACGSAACAAVVAAVRRELCARKVSVELPGGTLEIEWIQGEGNGRVLMTGPVAYVFKGEYVG